MDTNRIGRELKNMKCPKCRKNNFIFEFGEKVERFLVCLDCQHKVRFPVTAEERRLWQ